MVRRWTAVLLVLTVLSAAALAEPQWPQDTEGQKTLREYTERLNQRLTEACEMPVNNLFEIYQGFAVMGITREPDAETPEGVEITVKLSPETIRSIELRVSDPDRFPRIAASILLALYGDAMDAREAIRIPQDRADRAKDKPANSFEEPVEEMNGTVPRVYYAYYPDQYHDGTNWLQMTLIFPMAGTWDGNGLILGEEEAQTKPMTPEDEGDPDYEGYFSRDDYEHFEVFLTPTPEPDSAAAEYDFR